jgi:hypothetical protein
MDWVFANTGQEPWPANTQLVLVEGDAMAGTRAVPVVSAPPQMQVTVRQRLTVPVRPGTHTGIWRLMTAAGYFGDPLWIIITTADAPAVASTASTAPGTVTSHGINDFIFLHGEHGGGDGGGGNTSSPSDDMMEL